MNHTPTLPIRKWQQLSLSRRQHLPSTGGLYAVVDMWGNILYVGKSNNLNARWNSTGQRRHHRYWLATLHPGCRLRYFETKAFDIMEAVYIERLAPPWNNSPTPWWATQDNPLLGKLGAAGWLLVRLAISLLARLSIPWDSVIIAGIIVLSVILIFGI
jgi:hypothetical protein